MSNPCEKLHVATNMFLNLEHQELKCSDFLKKKKKAQNPEKLGLGEE